MPTFEVITDKDIYWAHMVDVKTFEVANELRFYTTAEFMRLVALKCGKGGKKHFQLSEDVMTFFFNRDQSSLMITSVEEYGDPFTTVHATNYLDQNTQNTWKVEVCRADGTRGINATLYIYHYNDLVFKSNPTMKREEK